MRLPDEDRLLEWLLEEDSALPSVRYLALRWLLHLPDDDPRVRDAHGKVMCAGPVPAILAHQNPEGWWEKPGPGYYGKYKGTAHTVVMLAMLGADGADPRVQAAGNYVLDHARAPSGGFSLTGTAGGLIHCLQGNHCAALLDLGFTCDLRLASAIGWLARSVTGEGIAPNEETGAPVRYLRSGNCAPGFCCSANDYQPCAWGAVKALLALGRIPPEERTPAIEAAIRQGVDFLFSCDPASAAYPSPYTGKPNGSWFKLGFPLGYVSDVLQIIEALTALGHAGDPRLRGAWDWLLSRRGADGRWRMEYTYNGKTWVDIEVKNQPSKWVTLRALRALSHLTA